MIRVHVAAVRGLRRERTRAFDTFVVDVDLRPPADSSLAPVPHGELPEWVLEGLFSEAEVIGYNERTMPHAGRLWRNALYRLPAGVDLHDLAARLCGILEGADATAKTLRIHGRKVPAEPIAVEAALRNPQDLPADGPELENEPPSDTGYDPLSGSGDNGKYD